VIAHATGSRTQEIGVRMALGADTSNIMMLVMKRGLWQIAVRLALGLGAAFPVTRIMASLPIAVSPSDPAVFVAVASVLVAVGLFACWLPARKAAALDPVKAIRVEQRSRPGGNLAGQLADEPAIANQPAIAAANFEIHQHQFSIGPMMHP